MGDVTLKQLPSNVVSLVDPGFEEALCILSPSKPQVTDFQIPRPFHC